MADGLEMQGLDDLESSLLEMTQQQQPTETKKFLRKQGTKLKRLTIKKAKSLVNKKTGNYLKGIKRGKPYKYQSKEMAIRVYNSMPHAHLIEDGHRIVTKNGEEVGFKRGKKVFKKSLNEFEEKFIEDVKDWLDEVN